MAATLTIIVNHEDEGHVVGQRDDDPGGVAVPGDMLVDVPGGLSLVTSIPDRAPGDFFTWGRKELACLNQLFFPSFCHMQPNLILPGNKYWRLWYFLPRLSPGRTNTETDTSTCIYKYVYRHAYIDLIVFRVLFLKMESTHVSLASNFSFQR